jgi:secondary thiamine-phosphate synthase enzyme
MPVKTEFLHLSTKGHCQIADITAAVEDKLRQSGLQDGTVTVSVRGSTGGITTCEYEPGLVKDLKELFDRLIPAGDYHHDAAWGDGNGHSHLRASLLGPSITVPFKDRQLLLGTWQQIIFIDFDNRGRQREIIVQFIGE